MIAPSPITGKIPRIARTAFIAPTAVIIGDVTIEDGGNIWYGAVLRGDRATIRVGRNTSVQEQVTLHAERNTTCFVQDHVIVGHHAMIHGECTVESGCMVGINAVVLQESRVGKGSIVAAGAVVRGTVMPLSLMAGVPAILKRTLSETHLGEAIERAEEYVETARAFIQAGLNHPSLDAFLMD